jgi:hypothetical protein
MMLLRGSTEQLSERLGRAMLLLSGGVRMGATELRGADEIVSRLLTEISAALGRSFGVATLPESVPPSAVQN